jgi:hypothetical protein
MAVASGPAFGYGSDGHRIIGAIADQLLKGTPDEIELHQRLRPGETLESMSTWADEIKSGPLKLNNGAVDPESADFLATNPLHALYHYTDVPFQLRRYAHATIGTEPHDLVHSMCICIDVLRGRDNPATNPTGISAHAAWLLLVHFVGDIHQPFHVGTGYIAQVDGVGRFVSPTPTFGESDRGGNALRTNLMSVRDIRNPDGTTTRQESRMPLHAYWDFDAVTAGMPAGATPAQYAASLLQQIKAEKSWRLKGDPATWPEQMANDMLPLADRFHQNLHLGARHEVKDREGKTRGEWDVTISEAYQANARQAARTLLVKAGYRLAALVTELLNWRTAVGNGRRSVAIADPPRASSSKMPR